MSKRQTRDRDSGPLKLGLVYGVLLAIGFVAAVFWVFRVTPSRGLGTTLPVAVSALATYAIGLLALAALENSLASRFDWPHIWTLPMGARFRPDFLVAALVLVGVVAGFFLWQ